MLLLTEYSAPTGDVQLWQEDNVFAVIRRKIITPGVYRVKQTSGLSYIDACQKYMNAKFELNSVVNAPAHCQYNSSQMRLCNSKNCPKKLGGAAYWEIFANSCLYKSR